MNINLLYDKAVFGIESVLAGEYNMSPHEAREAIRGYMLLDWFNKNPELASQTSCETFAEDIYEWWHKRQSDRN